MNIRKATLDDVIEIRHVYDAAKEYMNRSGNPNQWKVGHPPESVLMNDIACGQLYVIEENGIHGVFAFIPGVDPTYNYIEGEWLREAPYAAMHRIASDGEMRGVFTSAVKYCKSKVAPDTDLRVDTHRDNKTMQHVIMKNGFEECGVIYLENGDPRIAYQRIYTPDEDNV